MIDRSALEFMQEHFAGGELPDRDDIQSAVYCLPSSSKLESIERFQDAPNRTKATAHLSSSASFCAYVNRFKGEETSVYIDVDGGKFSAVLDHHGSDAPSWCSHLASFQPKKSLEWNAWTSMHNKNQSQLDFAQAIEQLLDSIQEPEPNVMLKAALDFQSNENLALGSTQNLDDGSVRFNFTKDNVSKTVTFPHRIKLKMPVHENEAPEVFEARVRYRVTGEGVLVFKFQFVKDPSAIEREAMLRLAEKTRNATEGLDHYEGSLAPAQR